MVIILWLLLVCAMGNLDKQTDHMLQYREMPNFHVLSVDAILVEDIIIKNDHVVLKIDSADSMLTDMVLTSEIVDRNLEITIYGFIDMQEEYSSGSCFVIWAQAEQYDTISIVDEQKSRIIYSVESGL